MPSNPVTGKEVRNVERFWQMLKDSIITQSTITIIIVGTTCYMIATERTVPELLAYLTTTVVGFFFGAKSKQGGE